MLQRSRRLEMLKIAEVNSCNKLVELKTRECNHSVLVY